MCTERAKSIGFSSKTTLKQGIKNTIEWYNKNKNQETKDTMLSQTSNTNDSKNLITGSSNGLGETLLCFSQKDLISHFMGETKIS